MEREAFDKSLRTFAGRVPFRPFTIELKSGDLLPIHRPEAVMCRAGVAVHFSKAGIPTLFDHRGVARLTGSGDVASSS